MRTFGHWQDLLEGASINGWAVWKEIMAQNNCASWAKSSLPSSTSLSKYGQSQAKCCSSHLKRRANIMESLFHCSGTAVYAILLCALLDHLGYFNLFNWLCLYLQVALWLNGLNGLNGIKRNVEIQHYGLNGIKRSEMATWIKTY